MAKRDIPIRGAAEIAKSREAAKLASQVLTMITEHVKPGVTTDDLDVLCREYIVDVLGAIPANIGYHGYPKTLCTSVNHVVCHGIPTSRPLRDGDIVNLDIAVIKDGWFGDTSRMYFVGEPNELARRLVATTYEAMHAGIRAVRPGATLGDVGYAIQQVAHREGFSVVREYCGHGIGREMHEPPQVLHWGKPQTGLVLQEGMVFTIEPMLNEGRRTVRTEDDGWTVVTTDGKLSAQFEHTVAVTRHGVQVLTLRPDERAPN